MGRNGDTGVDMRRMGGVDSGGVKIGRKLDRRWEDRWIKDGKGGRLEMGRGSIGERKEGGLEMGRELIGDGMGGRFVPYLVVDWR